MDTSGCPPGYFSDIVLSELPSSPCSQPVWGFVLMVTFIVATRASVIILVSKNWYDINKRRIRSIKKGYWLKKRLPITPTLVALSGIASILFCLLTALNIVNAVNRNSFIVVGLYLVLSLLLGYVAFLRFVRMGLKIVPLVRNQKRPSAPTSSFRDLGVRENALSPIMDVNREQSEVEAETEADVGENDSSGAKDTQKELYQYYRQGQSYESGTDFANGNEDISRRADTSRFDSTLKLLSALLNVCNLASGLICIFGGKFYSDPKMILTITFYFYGVAHGLNAGVYYWQLRRNIVALKMLSVQSIISEGDVQKSIKWLNQQRKITVFASVLYSICAFYIAVDTVNRDWWVFFMGDILNIAHQALLTYLAYVRGPAKQNKISRKRTKAAQRPKLQRDYSNVKRVIQTSSVFDEQSNGSACVSPARMSNAGLTGNKNKKASNGESVTSSVSQYGDKGAFPTYEEAWAQGFRWRRWSFDPERERRAFIVEYKNWLRQQKKRDDQ